MTDPIRENNKNVKFIGTLLGEGSDGSFLVKRSVLPHSLIEEVTWKIPSLPPERRITITKDDEFLKE
jgi:hypothetical protein